MIGVNASAGTVTLQNPWNTATSGTGLEMTFNESIAQLAADGCTLFATTGASSSQAVAAYAAA